MTTVSQVIKTEIIVQICSFFIPLSLFFILFSILFKFLFENLKEISNFKLNKFLGLVFGVIKGFSFMNKNEVIPKPVKFVV